MDCVHLSGRVLYSSHVGDVYKTHAAWQKQIDIDLYAFRFVKDDDMLVFSLLHGR